MAPHTINTAAYRQLHKRVIIQQCYFYKKNNRYMSARVTHSVCISGYLLSGYPDLSVNFMAAKNPDIFKRKSGCYGCLQQETHQQ